MDDECQVHLRPERVCPVLEGGDHARSSRHRPPEPASEPVPADEQHNPELPAGRACAAPAARYADGSRRFAQRYTLGSRRGGLSLTSAQLIEMGVEPGHDFAALPPVVLAD